VIVFERADELREHHHRALPQSCAIDGDPLRRAIRQHVALVQVSGCLQRAPVTRESPPRRGFERGDIRVTAPGQCSGTRLDEAAHRRPFFAKVMQFPAEIGQRLRIGRLRPQRAGYPLAKNRRTGRMKHEKRKDLLLPRRRHARGRAVVSNDSEPSKQLHAQWRQLTHGARLLRAGAIGAEPSPVRETAQAAKVALVLNPALSGIGMPRRRATPHDEIGPIEHRLTMHLERAHELGERAKRSNGAVQHEIERAQEIADRLRNRVSSTRPRR